MHTPQRTASHPILVGRDAELAELSRVLEDAAAGSGSLVLVSGEAGIGKTTLVQELAARAGDLGIRSLHGACFERVTPAPYGIWAELETNYRASFPFDAASRLERSPTRQSQDQFFHEKAAFINVAAGEMPLLLILEDIHWADSASIDFLCYFAPRLSSLRVVVVCTYRDNEISHNSRLNQSFPTLARGAETVRLQLHPFDIHVTEELIERRYDLSRPMPANSPHTSRREQRAIRFSSMSFCELSRPTGCWCRMPVDGTSGRWTASRCHRSFSSSSRDVSQPCQKMPGNSCEWLL